MQGDATNAQSMAKCLDGVQGAVLAFQGHNYLSAGRVDEGVSLLHLAVVIAKAGCSGKPSVTTMIFCRA